MTEVTPVIETPTPAIVETPSLLGGDGKPVVAAPVVAAPTEFVPDTTKTEAENAAAKTAFDTAKADAIKAEATKVANDTKATPFKVEELKLPDGMILDEPTSKGFVEIVNKFGLPRDAVAALTTLQANVMKGLSEKGNSDWNTTQETWRTEVSNDPEIGGDKTAPTLGAISKLVDKYGTPELRGVFDLTGAGNHPQVIKFLSKIAKDLGEGTFVSAGMPGTGAQDAATKLFPHQK